MNRREVDDVEVHARDVVEMLGGGGERTVLTGLGAGRAGEELVPRAEPRPDALDDDTEGPVVGEPARPVGVAIHDREEFGVDPGGDPVAHRPRLQLSGSVGQPASVVARGPLDGFPNVLGLLRGVRCRHLGQRQPFLPNSLNHESNRSTQASTVYSWRPNLSTTNAADQSR